MLCTEAVEICYWAMLRVSEVVTRGCLYAVPGHGIVGVVVTVFFDVMFINGQ